MIRFQKSIPVYYRLVQPFPTQYFRLEIVVIPATAGTSSDKVYFTQSCISFGLAAESYEAYLKKIVELSKKVQQPASSSHYPSTLNSRAKQAFYDNLEKDENLTVLLDAQIKHMKKDGWYGNPLKERELRLAVKKLLPNPEDIAIAYLRL